MEDQKEEKKQNPTTTVFCAQCQEDTPHEISVQPHNKEVVLTCACGRFLKFAPGTSTADMKKFLAVHKDTNVGQILTVKHEAEINELIESVARDLA